ncbi:MAG TPA: TetR/AcrR family transcriptional regulator [Solimonas sp.]|nr:TetR/AcrR family transcriptional regulator [Solimonas sp.]
MSKQTPPAAPGTGRIYRGLSGEARRSERQQRLIETAIEAFGTRGIRHVSVREICAASGFTPRYFYESFKDLDELLAATVDLLLQGMIDDLRAALLDGPRDDPAQVARRMVRAYLEFLRKDARATRILMVEIYGMGLDMDRLANRFVLSLGAEFQPLLALQKNWALPRKASSGLIVTGILGAMVFIGTRWVATGFGAPIESVTESCMALITR